MDERELSDMLWRSCYLGMRITLQSINTPDSYGKFKECIRLLAELARNETTLHDEQYTLAGLDPESKRLVIGLGNQSVIADRDLAPKIVAGFDRATSADEQPPESLPLYTGRSPLRSDEGGVVRVGRGRISLDLVVEQYENGMTPEEMVRAYDTLVLADAYAAIAYYLSHRDEVRAYLKRREEEAGALRAKIEAERPRIGREELLARRAAKVISTSAVGKAVRSS